MNEEEQWLELQQVAKNPMILLSAGGRDAIQYLAEEGETEKIRLEAKRLMNSVPCPTCE
jgi:hypothetical protein